MYLNANLFSLDLLNVLMQSNVFNWEQHNDIESILYTDVKYSSLLLHTNTVLSSMTLYVNYYVEN